MSVAVNEKRQAGEAARVPHEREVYRQFLTGLPADAAIAIEASEEYGWIVDEIHRCPQLCNLSEAKRRMPMTKKTDKPCQSSGFAPAAWESARRLAEYEGRIKSRQVSG